MPVQLSKHFKADKAAFDKTGAFDGVLDLDTRLFVDPLLLHATTVPELKDGRAALLAYFAAILKLLSHSKKIDDPFWRGAQQRLRFQENPAFGLGYATKGTGGSGIGAQFRDKILATAKLIVDAGITDPEIFELVGVFEEGIGCDRISDMTCTVLLPRFYAYSERIYASLGVPGEDCQLLEKTYKIPLNPYRPAGTPALLVPREILRDLPVAESWEDIGYAADENERIRNGLNKILGVDWRERREQFTKARVREILLKEPQLIRELIASYKSSPAEQYDFSNDPLGEVVWLKIAEDYTGKHPLALAKRIPPREAALAICDQFKKFIEDHGLWYVLYRDSTSLRPKPERAAQLIFFMTAHLYCSVNDLDVSPESNGGRGPVDFKLTRGAHGKTIVEAKLSTNGKLLAAYDKQVEIYKRAENADHAVMLVILVSKNTKLVDKLLAHDGLRREAGKPGPQIVVVDGRRPLSASKA